MIVPLLVAVVLAQGTAPYYRSRVKPYTESDHCLYWSENMVLTWKASVNGNPDTPGEGEFDAMRASFASWNTALNACSSLRFQEGERTSSRTIGWLSAVADQPKNENILVFRTRVCDPTVAPATDPCWDDANDNDDCGNKFDCWVHQSGAIALTTTTYDPQSGRILDTDIEFNAARFFQTVSDVPCVPPGNWGPNCTSWDIQNTLTHEIGHALGLDHTNAPGSTMNPSAPPGETSKRTLDTGTSSFVCDAYPAGQVAQDCVIRPFKPTLGDVPSGCGCGSAAGGALVLALAPVLALFRRRRR
ncbi:MAG: matrixin family metalloprotease [Myxococcaceae bacterium]|nr:matrixin family metalloprotease [Myxococcaceae bacterium]